MGFNWYNPADLAGKVKEGAEWVGGKVGDYADSMDRSKRAEEMYGGVDKAGMGVPNFDRQYGGYQGLAARYAGQDSAFRNQQRSLGNILAAEARGQGVGQQLVRKQAQLSADRAGAQQFGAVAGARPGMQAMASRNAMLGSALAQSQVGENASLGSAQMTLGAQQQYGQHLGQARGQDMQQQQQNNSAELAAYQQRLQLSGMQQQGALTAEQLRAQRYAALMGAPTSSEIITGGIVGLAGAGASAMAGKPGG